MKCVAILALATLAKGHDDREGFCSAVLPTYPRVDDGVDIHSFVFCECEDSHANSGQSIVVCRYNRTSVGDNNGDIQLTTGSCDAKICSFTKSCSRPESDFDEAELDAKDFNPSLFNPWCTDNEWSSMLGEEETTTNNPTESPSLASPPNTPAVPVVSSSPTPNPRSDGGNNANTSESNRIDRTILSLQILSASIIFCGFSMY